MLVVERRRNCLKYITNTKKIIDAYLELRKNYYECKLVVDGKAKVIGLKILISGTGPEGRLQVREAEEIVKKYMKLT